MATLGGRWPSWSTLFLFLEVAATVGVGNGTMQKGWMGWRTGECMRLFAKCGLLDKETPAIETDGKIYFWTHLLRTIQNLAPFSDQCELGPTLMMIYHLSHGQQVFLPHHFWTLSSVVSTSSLALFKETTNLLYALKPTRHLTVHLDLALPLTYNPDVKYRQ